QLCDAQRDESFDAHRRGDLLGIRRLRLELRRLSSHRARVEGGRPARLLAANPHGVPRPDRRPEPGGPRGDHAVAADPGEDRLEVGPGPDVVGPEGGALDGPGALPFPRLSAEEPARDDDLRRRAADDPDPGPDDGAAAQTLRARLDDRAPAR